MQGNLQAIQNANLQLQAFNESTNRALERRLLIERQITDAQAVAQPRPPRRPDDAGAVAGTRTATRAGPRPPCRIPATLHARSSGSLSLERHIADLVVRVENETPVGAAQGVPERPVSPAEAAQKKRIRDLQAELAVIDHQLTANRAEDQRLKTVIADYQSKVDAVPTRESELVELTRDYSTLQAAYAKLLDEAEDAHDRRQPRAAADWRAVPDPRRGLDARKAVQPAAARRHHDVRGGTGPVAGLLAIGWLEYRDSSFRREEEAIQDAFAPGARSGAGDVLGSRSRAVKAADAAARPGRHNRPASGSRRAGILASAVLNKIRRCTDFLRLAELPFELTANPKYLFFSGPTRSVEQPAVWAVFRQIADAADG